MAPLPPRKKATTTSSQENVLVTVEVAAPQGPGDTNFWNLPVLLEQLCEEGSAASRGASGLLNVTPAGNDVGDLKNMEFSFDDIAMDWIADKAVADLKDIEFSADDIAMHRTLARTKGMGEDHSADTVPAGSRPATDSKVNNLPLPRAGVRVPQPVLQSAGPAADCLKQMAARHQSRSGGNQAVDSGNSLALVRDVETDSRYNRFSHANKDGGYNHFTDVDKDNGRYNLFSDANNNNGYIPFSDANTNNGYNNTFSDLDRNSGGYRPFSDGTKNNGYDNLFSAGTTPQDDPIATAAVAHRRQTHHGSAVLFHGALHVSHGPVTSSQTSSSPDDQRPSARVRMPSITATSGVPGPADATTMAGTPVVCRRPSQDKRCAACYRAGTARAAAAPYTDRAGMTAAGAQHADVSSTARNMLNRTSPHLGAVEEAAWVKHAAAPGTAQTTTLRSMLNQTSPRFGAVEETASQHLSASTSSSSSSSLAAAAAKAVRSRHPSDPAANQHQQNRLAQQRAASRPPSYPACFPTAAPPASVVAAAAVATPLLLTVSMHGGGGVPALASATNSSVITSGHHNANTPISAASAAQQHQHRHQQQQLQQFSCSVMRNAKPPNGTMGPQGLWSAVPYTMLNGVKGVGVNGGHPNHPFTMDSMTMGRVLTARAGPHPHIQSYAHHQCHSNPHLHPHSHPQNHLQPPFNPQPALCFDGQNYL